MWPLKAPSFLAKRLPRVEKRVPHVASRPPEFPALILPAQRLADRLESGAHRRARKGSGQEFWQYRPALPHEPLRHIDWRQSARSQQLWVREQEMESPQTLAVWCDTSPSMAWHATPNLPTKRHIAELAVLTLAASALRGGEAVTLISPPNPPHRYSGRKALNSFADRLASIRPSSCPEAQDIPPQAEVLLVSDFLWTIDVVSEVFTKLTPLLHHVNLICVLDPAEEAIPFRGRTELLAPNDEASHTSTIDEAVAIAYQHAMTHHLGLLSSYITKHGGSLTILRTTDDLSITLRPLHARLARKSRLGTR